jgi:type II restriction enzyme
MNLQMDYKIADEYKNPSQKIRIITENWVANNIFCPYCGNSYVSHFENNRPVADFYCPKCSEEYELKSKHSPITSKITDGAYETMINRINSVNNPNFFFMQYEKNNLAIKNFILVPKYFFTPEIIEKRNALSPNARRAGWIGCNIILNNIPNEGRIFIIKNEIEQPIDDIIKKVINTNFIKQYKLDARGWIIDILNCINKIEDTEFTLSQMYEFEPLLKIKYPENHHIKEKIRQQLQILRDKGLIEFKGHGVYQKRL